MDSTAPGDPFDHDHIRITLCRSIGRVQTTITRSVVDGERRLIVSTPWQQPPIETYQQVRPQLTREEAQALAAAFDLDGPA
jgi:hypothetical protein